MFAADSYDTLQTVGEIKQAVLYLAKNEMGFREELRREGLSYDDIEAEIQKVWVGLLNACKRVKYTDYTVQHRKSIYSFQ